MRLFTVSLAAAAFSLTALAGCTNSVDENGSDSRDMQQSRQTEQSPETLGQYNSGVRPGHYEIVTTPDGTREVPYKGSEQDHMETIKHPGGVQQKIYDPSGGK
jgi:hypothetical protein